jgi:hypothetical protein
MNARRRSHRFVAAAPFELTAARYLATIVVAIRSRRPGILRPPCRERAQLTGATPKTASGRTAHTDAKPAHPGSSAGHQKGTYERLGNTGDRPVLIRSVCALRRIEDHEAVTKGILHDRQSADRGTCLLRVDGFLHNVCHEDRVPGILGFVADVISTTLEVINENAPLDRRMAYLRPAALEVIRPESPAGTQRCTVQLRMSHLC